MGYKVKWVEENLGVSRKALRNFEKHGLMPANEGGGYRDYSDEDIERIWAIRLFQGMGYTLKELVKLSERLISITADGIVDDSEIDDFVSIQEELEKISITVEALQLWTEQMVANGAIDMDKYEDRRKRN